VEAAPAPVAVEAPAAELDMGELRSKARETLFSAEEPAETPEVPASKPEEKPEPPKTKDELDLSKSWAKHDRERASLARKKAEFAALVKEFETKQAEFEPKNADLQTAYSDPIAFLGKAGWDKDKIMQWVMGDGKVDPELLVKQLETRHQEEIRKLREERDQEKQELEDARRARELERVESELYQDVSAQLKDPRFELLQKLVAKNPKQEAVLQKKVGEIIAAVYKKSGNETVVDPADALAYLQAELAEIQLADPAPSPAVKPAKLAAVEPKPITNSSHGERVVSTVTYDETDPAQRKERARQILAGEIEPDED
jgi:vacuolar-type H+-ATPase subunit I/STV1